MLYIMARSNTAGSVVETMVDRFRQVIADNPESALAFLLGSDAAPVERETPATKRDPVKPAADRPSDRPADRPSGNRGPKKGSRRANIAYQVVRNRRGNPIGEAKRPADQATWKFMLRHKSPQSQLQVEDGTGLSQKVVQNNLWRLGKEGLIERVPVK